MSLGQDGPSTRTRMPEGHAGHGGPGRRPQPRRALVTVVGIVVLLIAAIAFANRGGQHSPSTGTGAGTGTAGGSSSDAASGAGGPAASTTAPSGQRPVTGKSAAGIPSGFAHTAEGAQSAAANYAVALGGVDMFNADRRHQIVSAVYAAEVASSSQSELDKAYSDPTFLNRIGLQPDGAAPSGMTFVSRTNPVGAKADRYDTDSATVSVWYSSLFGLAGEGSTNPVTESWFTNTFEMKWTAGDWKITGFQQKDGPAPVGRDQAASSAKDMSDAVSGFGGFTYAR
ncbi:hypothetical protein GA0115240_12822 [Streptomyces sp. DvalAA-14]|uniref:hypothetical protein n=1 Tax=unclassified Streptomyces TaxID=2593676 RepID=UPI00081B0999|nr:MULTISPECIES: hypothetical protein [unclassified Streptomyces]MYS21248.1 hypothetical protein [Streptomyces sp. SID4948]SCD87912.1 hypothetical protein GA0115240_12822 [Streptomyces sp. DvalAA-14]